MPFWPYAGKVGRAPDSPLDQGNITVASTVSGPTIAARVDRLPANRYVRKLVTLISFGGWFEFYDLFFTAYVAVGLFKGGLFKPTTQGLFDLEGFASFIAALFTGLFLGTIAFSWLSDRFGRRAIFTFSLLWYSIGSLIMAFQTTSASIDLWRLIASIGIGVELVNIDTYISELVPKEQRGPAFAYNQFVMFTVVPVVALLAWLLVPQTILGLDSWRWVVMIGSVGAVLVWWIRLALPESPRWLAQRGRMLEAESIMRDMEERVAAETRQPLPAPEMLEGEPHVRGPAQPGGRHAARRQPAGALAPGRHGSRHPVHPRRLTQAQPTEQTS
jgi:putative MFS transporter